MNLQRYFPAELEIISVCDDLLTNSLEVKDHDDDNSFGPLYPLKP